MKTPIFFFLLLPLLLLTACSKQPVPINYGKDVCAYCKMTITDARFASELVTKKGKNYKFDSIECLIHFLREGSLKQEDIQLFLVSDFKSPKNLIDATSAWYLISTDIQSPMGANLASFSRKEDAEKFKTEHSGTVFSWKEIQQELKN